MIPYILTTENVTAIIGGESYTVPNTHPNFKGAVQALKEKNWQKFKALSSLAQAITEYGKGKIRVVGNQVVYKDKTVNHVVVDRILAFLKEGLDVQPLLNFLERLLNNPSMRSVEQLYQFLENKGLPIGEDGCFYAYKAVTKDLKDKWTRTIDNRPGDKPKMERNEVNDDPNMHCSRGLHAGSLEYVNGYSYNDDRIIIVKIDPRHVVSVPNDCSCQKIRVETYEVVGFYKQEMSGVKFNSDELDGYVGLDDEGLEVDCVIEPIVDGNGDVVGVFGFGEVR